MAFIDENGKITIDENAAERDIKNLRISKEHLSTALSVIKQIEVESAEFEGATGTALGNTAQQLQVEIKKLLAQTEETIYQIRYVIDKYQAIDASLKETIQGFYQ